MRIRRILALTVASLAMLGVGASASATPRSAIGQEAATVKKDAISLDSMKAKNETTLAWYAEHGIDVRTVDKGGYSWVNSTDEDLRQAAAAKGVIYEPKVKVNKGGFDKTKAGSKLDK
ncbi:hypothetical protein [Micromonospora sp. LOL_024]|uniref:hypothetical protein n=1 Tax=Micromonospora sp. LOL_024 TaxID=3345412 RepID=UPI003A886B94